jgi:hypothetical protein
MTVRPNPVTEPSMARVGWTVQRAFYDRESHATRESKPSRCREAAQSNFAAAVDAPMPACSRWLHLGRRATEQSRYFRMSALRILALLLVCVPTALADSNQTTLRKMLASHHYTTNSVPAAWRPATIPATASDLSAFERVSLLTDSISISKFIARYGLPSLTGASRHCHRTASRPRLSAVGIVPRCEPGTARGPSRLGGRGCWWRCRDTPSRYLTTKRTGGQDFLIYDLPSGHAVALHVPKPAADAFAVCVIVTSDGSLVRLIK